MSRLEALRLSKCTMLMPIGLRLAAFVEEEWSEGEDMLVWERIEVHDTKPDAKMRCLWDFIELAEASGKRFLSFIRRWGLLDFGDDADGSRMNREAWSEVLNWRLAAREAKSMLLAMAATEEGTLVSDDVLLALADGDDYQPGFPTHLLERHAPLEEYIEWKRQARLDHYRVERRAGRGLALQRGMLTNLLLAWANPIDVVPSWDDSGRTLDTTATGARQIVGAQLAAIFSAPQLDLYVCSVCGQPYSSELVGRQRRPRKGVRALCSDSCRKVAKLADNRASWLRNSDRWTANRRTKRAK